MLDVVSKTIDGLIRDNPDVQQTYNALLERGDSIEWAREEIARVFLGCMWEANKELPDRWLKVLRALRDGHSTAELFPDSFYEEEAQTTGGNHGRA